MATVQRQNTLAWMLGLAFMSLGRCRSLTDGKVWTFQTKAGFTRQNASIHAKSSSEPSIERVLYYGHLTIGTKKLNLTDERNPTGNKTELFSEFFEKDVNYQSDSIFQVAQDSEHLAEEVVSQWSKKTRAVDRLLGMTPKVECVEDSMTLKLNGATSLGFHVLVDRGNAHPVPLLKMPSDCGYSVRRTWRDLVFSAPYNGCFVAQEESVYVLPLVIYGLPVRMTCPSTAPKAPSVSCHASGMTVEIESSATVKNIQVKVNSKWESLMKISPHCGFSVVEHPKGVVISAPYLPCIKEQDGLLTFEVAAEGDFKISCPFQRPTIVAMVTACPDSSSNPCLITSLPGPLKPEQTPPQSTKSFSASVLPPEQPKYPANQFALPYNTNDPARPEHVDAQHPQTPVQFPVTYPFYAMLPGYSWPHLRPDAVAASPKPVHFEEPQHPQKMVPPSTPMEDPTKSMPAKKPGPMQFPPQFPFYAMLPGYSWPHPTPNTVAASSQLVRPLEPQHPQKTVLPSPEAPLDAVHPKKPTVVEDPSKSIPVKKPEPMQFPAQFPFYVIPPGYSWPHPTPNTVAASPEPETSEKPQHPQKTVVPSIDAVHPKNPAVVQDPSKSIKKPEEVQYPFYAMLPEWSWQFPQPDAVASPKPEHSVEPPHPQKTIVTSTDAPLDAVHPKMPTPAKKPEPVEFPFYAVLPRYSWPHPKPVVPSTEAPLAAVHPKEAMPVEDLTRSIPAEKPEPMQFPAQFQFYAMFPGYSWPQTRPEAVSASPEPEHAVGPQHSQNGISSFTEAPLDVHSKKPAPGEDPTKMLPAKKPEPMQFPPKYPFYAMYPGYAWPHHTPNTVTHPEPVYSVQPQQPQRAALPSTQAPLDAVHPMKPTPVKDLTEGLPAKIPEPIQFPPGYSWPHPMPNAVSPKPAQNGLVNAQAQPESDVASQTPKPLPMFDLPIHCSTVCTVSPTTCCPLSLSFHQHLHHHNHFSPVLHQPDQPATAGSGQETSYIKQLFRNALTGGASNQPGSFLNATQKPTSSTPSLQKVFYLEQDGKHLTQLLPSKLPNTQTAGEPMPNKLLRHANYLPPKSASSSNPTIPHNSPDISKTTTKSPGMSSLQAAKGSVSKPQSPVTNPAPYPWFQIPYFIPYHPPTSKSSTSSEQSSPPHQSPSSVVQSSQHLILSPPNAKPIKKPVPPSWAQHPFFIPHVLRPNVQQDMQSMPGVSSDPPRVHSTASKHPTLKLSMAPSGPGPQKQYWHQAAPAQATTGNGYPKGLFKPRSSKPQLNMIGPSNKNLAPPHSTYGLNAKSFVPNGSPQSFKDYWKPARPFQQY
ncbi:hypothetical protein ACEWY4_007201 [Coilia grayii]|uniref:Zona pellucida sperm-binding protein 1/4 Ig-like domain-containing protein n=1 Tax=Coilia grayii TaxID=363190 RepID=A0ABD1KFM9_9TELE